MRAKWALFIPFTVAIVAVALNTARAAGDDEDPRRPVTGERGQTAQTGQSIERRVKQYFAQNDSNKDGKLSRDEFPAPFRRAFDRIDADNDGQVTLEEDLAYRKSRASGAQRFRNRTPARQRPGTALRTKPTFENVSYGPHERNVLDFWKAESDKPTPVVVYIHGGGFRGGDKKGANQANIAKCLANGVSFAAINYRFRMTTTLDNIMLDIARAIQFLRHKSGQWNIDKSRFAAYGGSAGGGASLWLAVHDDLADPKSNDPVLRQSTRLTVAGHLNSQATYDCEKWTQIVGVPSSWTTEMGMTDDLDFYGVKSRDQVDSPKARQIRKKVDMLAFMDKGDPPLFLHNVGPKTEPQNKGRVIHHPRHAIYLKKQCDRLGIEAAIVLADTPPEKKADMLDFFFKHFKVKTKAREKALAEREKKLAIEVSKENTPEKVRNLLYKTPRVGDPLLEFEIGNPKRYISTLQDHPRVKSLVELAIHASESEKQELFDNIVKMSRVYLEELPLLGDPKRPLAAHCAVCRRRQGVPISSYLCRRGRKHIRFAGKDVSETAEGAQAVSQG